MREKVSEAEGVRGEGGRLVEGVGELGVIQLIQRVLLRGARAASFPTAAPHLRCLPPQTALAAGQRPRGSCAARASHARHLVRLLAELDNAATLPVHVRVDHLPLPPQSPRISLPAATGCCRNDAAAVE